MRITVETIIAAPVEAVWAAYTNPADIMVWNAASPDWCTRAASVDLREGGAFCSRMEAKDGSMGFDFAGIYTKIVPNQHLAYVFGDRSAEVDFGPERQGTRVTVSFDAETTFTPEQQRAGWQAILDNFRHFVERGQAVPSPE